MIKMDKIRCVGCSACVAICPTKALQWQTDEKGFIILLCKNRFV